MTVIATAGHVDHGKSSLVRALTGTDPDRLAEEKQRGLTIDIGFARLSLPSGEASFVDLPGHVRFLKNMLAGAGSAEFVLFVVAATEGWKPQTEEHLRILDALDVRHAVVAITKVDLVDDVMVALVREDIEERVAGTTLAGAELVEVSATTGHGLDELRDALARMVAPVAPPPDEGRTRLWVDRAFSIKGSGTVVTGTLTGGAIEQGDNLVVEPGSIAVKVRRLQSHGDEVTRIEPGRRAALNLSGIQAGDAGRGQAVVTGGAWHFTDRIDCSLTALAALSHPVRARGAYVVYLGTGEWPVRTRVIGAAEIEPGATGLVRLHLPTRLPLTPGDRYVIRESGRGETVGGGEVLDVAPVLPTTRAHPNRSVERVVAERGWVDTQELTRLTGGPAVGTVGPWVVDPPLLERAIATLSQKIDAALPLGVDIAALDTKERALLDAGMVERAVIHTGRVVREDTEDVLARHPWLAALAAKSFDPPPPTGITPAEVRLLVRRNAVIEREGVHFLPSTLTTALQAAAALLTDEPNGFTVAQLRVALDSTRRVIMPLLAELDARGLTRRNGDVRLITALGRDALSVASPPHG